MGRYINNIRTNMPANILFEDIRNYLTAEGYEYTSFQGEAVFKKGHGLVTGPSFFKFSFFDGYVRIEVWMKFAVLPGVYCGEIDLDSFIGAAVKGPLRRRTHGIEAYLAASASDINSARVALYSANAQSPVPVQTPSPVQTYAPVQAHVPEAASVNNAAPQVAEPRFCQHCGKGVDGSMAFCPFCGKSLR